MNQELIYDLCWKYHNLRHKMIFKSGSEYIEEKIPKILQRLLDEVNKSSQLKDNFSKSDLAEMISGGRIFAKNSLYNFTKKSFSKITEEDVRKFVDAHIFQNPTKYDFYFKFGWVADFPTGYKLGNGIFYATDKLPKQVKNFLISHIPYERERRSSLSDEEWLVFRKRDAYMKISVMASGEDKAQKKAFAQVNKNYNIYKIINGTRDDLDHAPFYFCMINYTTGSLRLNEAEKIKWSISKFPYFDEHVKKINKIFNKKNPSELEQRILDTIEVYGLIESNSSVHVKFLLCIIALETLLLSNNDLIGTKIAQRVSFLLADSRWWLKELFDIPLNKMNVIINQKFIDKHLLKSRLELNNKVKGFYDKRSRFTHSGKRKKMSESITEADYGWASYFVQWSVELVINHSKKYTHLSKLKKNNDKKYFELYFEELIYK